MPDQTPPLPAWATEECVEAIARAIDPGAWQDVPDVKFWRKLARKHARAAIAAAGPFVKAWANGEAAKLTDMLAPADPVTRPPIVIGAPAPLQSRDA